MKVCFVNLYKNTKFSFDDEIYLKIKEIDREFKILAPVDSNNLQYCKNYNYLNSKGINIDEKVIDYAIINKIFGNKYINSFNELYEKTKEENIDAFIIPLSNWKNLEYIKLSYLQLSNKNILFVLDEINKFEFDKFLSLVKYLDRFRNIHIGILNSNQERIDLYNLHDLRNENLLNILKLHINNRRKYIGLKYHLNEIRQKIKFHKDLYLHFVKSRYFNPYKEVLNSENKIPKVIHYCWFGRKRMPAEVKKCVEAWQKILPDYKIKCWNEDNFPFEKYRFAKEALERKKWAFIADIARLHALYYEGGIYLDTDVEILKKFDDFLHESAFTSYESLNLIAMAVLGAKKQHPWVGKMLLWYDMVHCDEDYTEIANTKVVSKITKLQYGVNLDGKDLILPDKLHIYPREYFSPKSEKDKWLTTDKTCTIHHFTGMW